VTAALEGAAGSPTSSGQAVDSAAAQHLSASALGLAVLLAGMLSEHATRASSYPQARDSTTGAGQGRSGATDGVAEVLDVLGQLSMGVVGLRKRGLLGETDGRALGVSLGRLLQAAPAEGPGQQAAWLRLRRTAKLLGAER
jgi:hypothetical protein